MTYPIQHPLNDPGEQRLPRYLGKAIRAAPGESYGWHTHEFGQLISAASGSMYVGTPDRVLLLSPAMVLWIPPDVEHWMQYGTNNEMHYVDVNRDEAAKIGSACRIVANTPLLRALVFETMPENQSARGAGHNGALHDLLRHELVAAPDVPLSIVMPQTIEFADLPKQHSAIRGTSTRLTFGLPMRLPVARPSNDCSSPRRACRLQSGCDTHASFTLFRSSLPVKR